MAVDLDAFRRKLIEQRAALLREDELSAADRAPVAQNQESVGRLSRVDAMQVQAMALARIDRDEYGYCLACGDAIAEARLLHSPSVATCAACARER